MSPDPSPTVVISDCPAFDAARTALILPKRALKVRSSSRLCAKAEPADTDPNPGSFAAEAAASAAKRFAGGASPLDVARKACTGQIAARYSSPCTSLEE